MTDLKRCERCESHHEDWTHLTDRLRRRLPEAKVKERKGRGVYTYVRADLCKGCATDLEDFMDQNLVSDD